MLRGQQSGRPGDPASGVRSPDRQVRSDRARVATKRVMRVFMGMTVVCRLPEGQPLLFQGLDNFYAYPYCNAKKLLPCNMIGGVAELCYHDRHPVKPGRTGSLTEDGAMAGLQSAGGPDSGGQEPILRDQVRKEVATADLRHLADGIGCTLRVRVSMDLLARAKALTGLEDTEQVLHAALVHLVMGPGENGGH